MCAVVLMIRTSTIIFLPSLLLHFFFLLPFQQATAIAETMVKYLLPAGYDVLTIDEFWYVIVCSFTEEPHA